MRWHLKRFLKSRKSLAWTFLFALILAAGVVALVFPLLAAAIGQGALDWAWR